MEVYFERNITQIAITLVMVILYPLTKYISGKIISEYAHLKNKNSQRTSLMFRLRTGIINVLFIIGIIITWGVKPDNVLVALSSVFAVIGAGLFAQWSVLCNITAGIIIYFNAPYTLGDRVRIHDSEVHEAIIEDILIFHTRLISPTGEIIVYPNVMLLQKGITVLPNTNDPQEADL